MFGGVLLPQLLESMAK